MKYELSPSLLSADFSNLNKDIKELESENVKYLHLDVMDGLFVPNISFGIPVIHSIRKTTNMIFDTHLMIEEPIRYIEQFKESGSDILTIHYEACKNVKETLSKIKLFGMKVGMSIKPNTKIKEIESFLPYIDLFLVMSVEPGFGGQKFIKDSLLKVKELYDIRSKYNMNFIIEIDGGINADNIKEVVCQGADLIVAGSAVFNGNIKENIKKLMQ